MASRAYRRVNLVFQKSYIWETHLPAYRLGSQADIAKPTLRCARITVAGVTAADGEAVWPFANAGGAQALSFFNSNPPLPGGPRAAGRTGMT
jgi:hypothetical protein